MPSIRCLMLLLFLSALMLSPYTDEHDRPSEMGRKSAWKWRDFLAERIRTQMNSVEWFLNSLRRSVRGGSGNIEGQQKKCSHANRLIRRRSSTTMWNDPPKMRPAIEMSLQH